MLCLTAFLASSCNPAGPQTLTPIHPSRLSASLLTMCDKSGLPLRTMTELLGLLDSKTVPRVTQISNLKTSFLPSIFRMSFIYLPTQSLSPSLLTTYIRVTCLAATVFSLYPCIRYRTYPR